MNKRPGPRTQPDPSTNPTPRSRVSFPLRADTKQRAAAAAIYGEDSAPAAWKTIDLVGGALEMQMDPSDGGVEDGEKL